MISGPVANQPLYKRIDNYVFNFDDMLGQGNFSKVYRGRHQITSTLYTKYRWDSSHKSYITQFVEVKKTIIIVILINWCVEKIKSSQYTKVLLSIYEQS